MRQRWMRHPWFRSAIAMSLLAGALVAMAAPASADGDDLPTYKHVFYIVEENRSFDQIIGNPDAPTFNQLATKYSLATDYFGTSHPSEPNYVAMVGGSDFGITNDGSYLTNVVDQPSLASQLEGNGLSWKSYSQSMPFAGFTGTCYPCNTTDPSSLYASKHNGFLNFTGVQSNPAEMQKLVPIEQLTADLASNTVPSFSFIVPDQCHDMHGTTSCPDATTNVKVADAYLAQLVANITVSKAWQSGQNAIVITWDEGGGTAGCCDANPGGGQIYTAVVTAHGPRGLVYPTPSNHYSMLAALQQVFGLGCLQHTCDTANVVPASPLFETE
jgi:phospholipase C